MKNILLSLLFTGTQEVPATSTSKAFLTKDSARTTDIRLQKKVLATTRTLYVKQSTTKALSETLQPTTNAHPHHHFPLPTHCLRQCPQLEQYPRHCPLQEHWRKKGKKVYSIQLCKMFFTIKSKKYFQFFLLRSLQSV